MALQERQLDGLVYNKVEKTLARIRYMAPIAEKRRGEHTGDQYFPDESFGF